jgi:LmbE family N-acetylglucosaminyl deacetylase
MVYFCRFSKTKLRDTSRSILSSIIFVMNKTILLPSTGKTRTVTLLLLLSLSPLRLLAQAESPKVLDGAELRLALEKLTILGSVLYVGAHPDDENTAFLTSMAKGRLVRAGYLSMTRGEGGQNLIGTEQGDLMGILRTQELLSARRIDGAHQFFSRAIDFGYSKTLDETMRIWGKERTLSDVVWVIRSFRPDVVVTRFTPTQGGHGNHLASAELADEAFDAAGDPNKFPEQLQYVKPWKPKRLVWNTFRFRQSDRAVRPENSVSLDLGAYSPLLGESFTEIAGRSRSMHKSQGFGASQNRGEFVNYFQYVKGDTASVDLFDGVNTSWSRVPGGEAVGRILDDAVREFDSEQPAKIIPTLLKAYAQMQGLPGDPWVKVKMHELIEVIKGCAGLWMDALASDYSAVPGDTLKLTTIALNRSDYPFVLEQVSSSLGGSDTLLHAPLLNNEPIQVNSSIRLPANVPYTQPYWLREKSELGSYRVSDQRMIGLPQNPPVLTVAMKLSSPDGQLDVDVPVRFRWVDPVQGEKYRPFEVVPPVALNLPENVYVFTKGEEKSLVVSVRSEEPDVSGDVTLRVPSGWTVKPEAIPFRLANKNEEQTVKFAVRPASHASSGVFSVEATVGDRRVGVGLKTVDYPHITPQMVFPPAEGKLLRIEMKLPRRNIAYIMGAGDEIPAALEQLGYHVTLLSDQDLSNGNLARFEVIIAGIRAYNTRSELRANQRKLMDYVQGGGTYIVQYVTRRGSQSEDLGPYPFHVSNDRVTVEEAPVEFLSPAHPLLNTPNKITAKDFDGWIQERGLYFADKWDPDYTTVLSSHDPGEQPKAGGLLVAHYGKGYYVYTGYAFFRQLPAGVAGAYRLFVNLVSLGK